MSIKRIAGWSLGVLAVCFLVVILVGIAYAYCLFHVPGDIDVACLRDTDGRLVINLRPNWRVRNVDRLTIWEEGEEDFSCDVAGIDPTMNRQIIYGVPPPGGF